MAKTPKKPKKPQWIMYRDQFGHFSCYRSSYIYDPVTNQNVEPIYTETSPSDCEFIAPMKLEEFTHGRGAHFYFRNLKDNREYMMQGTEMKELLLNHTMEKGFLFGKWGWIKRGDSLSIRLIEELEDTEGEEEDGQS